MHSSYVARAGAGQRNKRDANLDATRIIIIEDSRFFSQLVRKTILDRMPSAQVTIAASLAETRAAVDAADQPFHLALVDLVLPDGREGEALEFMQMQDTPCIVFTSIFSADLRERLFADNVVDYILKDTPSSLDYLVSLVEQLERNRSIKVLVVDDSRTARLYLTDMLKSHHFLTVEAANAQQALDILAQQPDIRLVLTDYHMPETNGVELTRRIRSLHPPDELALIGISSVGSHSLSAQFIKHGANDFLNKPFLREEFFCRITQNLRMLCLLDRLKENANRDFLTRLHNRRYFFESGSSLLASARRGQITLTAAVIDLDHFKRINDTHGHETGDQVLQAAARTLSGLIRKTDLLARLGGEEFAILAVNMDPAHAGTYFDSVRTAISGLEISCGGTSHSVTASIGVSHGAADSLSVLLDRADKALYRAKAEGRNRVVLEPA
jgi:diguanylate cyclase (GGDEF)-like protein